jgi:hypothetical protein
MEHEGKFFCTSHHPPTVEAKNKLRHERWAKESAASREKFRREAAMEKLLKRYTTAELENASEVQLIK